MLLLLLSRFSRVWFCATPQTAAHQVPHPLDSPGKNAGVGCHFLLQCVKVKVKVKSLSRVRPLATPWTAAHQAPPCVEDLLFCFSTTRRVVRRRVMGRRSGEGATPLSSAFRRRNLVPQSYKGPQSPFPKVRRGGFLLPSEALCRSPGLSPRREQRLQGQDSRPQQIRGKTHSGLTPSRPGSGQPPSRSVRSTLGDPLLANKNVLGRNLLGAPVVEFPAALVLPWGLPLSLVPPETCSAL